MAAHRPTRNRNVAPWAVAAAGASTISAYYFYSTQSKIALEGKGKALKGDGNWVDFKLSSSKELSSDVRPPPLNC